VQLRSVSPPPEPDYRARRRRPCDKSKNAFCSLGRAAAREIALIRRQNNIGRDDMSQERTIRGFIVDQHCGMTQSRHLRDPV